MDCLEFEWDNAFVEDCDTCGKIYLHVKTMGKNTTAANCIEKIILLNDLIILVCCTYCVRRASTRYARYA